MSKEQHEIKKIIDEINGEFMKGPYIPYACRNKENETFEEYLDRLCNKSGEENVEVRCNQEYMRFRQINSMASNKNDEIFGSETWYQKNRPQIEHIIELSVANTIYCSREIQLNNI